MQNLHLKNFRKSIDSKIKLADFTLLIGKNNSGKSNVAKSLLLLSDYLESDSILDFPINGQNSIYHNIHDWKELQTWQVQDQRQFREGQEPNLSNLPEIRIGISGGATLSVSLRKNESQWPFSIMVNYIEVVDIKNSVLFKASITDFFYTEVYYSIDGIQQFFKSNNIKEFSSDAQNGKVDDIHAHLNKELIDKKARLEETNNPAEKARILTEISNLKLKSDRLSSHNNSIKNPKNSSFQIRTNYADYSKRTVLELLSSYFPSKWSKHCAQHNGIKDYESDTFENSLSEIDLYFATKASEVVDQRIESLEDEEEVELGPVSGVENSNYKIYKEITAKFSKFIFDQLGQVFFSPVNRYSPHREFIDTQIFSQRNNVDLIRDVSTLLWNNYQISFKGDEESFLNKWLVEFGISTNHREEDGMLLQIRKDSNLGFSIFVHDNSLWTTRGISGYVNLADKGYGSGQIMAMLLKIIVSYRAMANQRKIKSQYATLILEEPESNLHPDYQAKLIDMLWDAQQKFNIRFILECHSEYMIRRLQVLVKNKDLSPSQISISYFNDAEINQIGIQDNGFLDKPIPTGFMDIAAHMAIEIL